MEDERIWAFETSLWTADAEHYRDSIDEHCVMVLPATPFVLAGEEAIRGVIDTPRWTDVEISDRKVMRPQEGLIVIAYKANAAKEGAAPYEAYCTSTYRRLGHEDWKVVQHQQTPPIAIGD